MSEREKKPIEPYEMLIQAYEKTGERKIIEASVKSENPSNTVILAGRIIAFLKLPPLRYEVEVYTKP